MIAVVLGGLALLVALVALVLGILGFRRSTPALVDLAEFKLLDPELKQLYRKSIVEGIMPDGINNLNSQYRRLSPEERKAMLDTVEYGVSMARAEARRMDGINVATKVPEKLADMMS